MKKITKMQILTMIAIILYGVWEFYVAKWAKTEMGPIIRVDLVILYPILGALILISIVQFFKNKK